MISPALHMALAQAKVAGAATCAAVVTWITKKRAYCLLAHPEIRRYR
jgi:hypothetical protein